MPTVTPHSDILYSFEATNEDGCSAMSFVQVKLLLEPIIPNAFSPNGDGINDTWNIRHLSDYAQSTIDIFDRYGRIVYKATGYNTPWDGKLSGKDLPVGTYYYIIRPGSGRKVTTGSVTILR